MRLNTSEWQEFFLHDLYEIRMGNGFDKNKMTYDAPSVNFVSRVSYNNGVDDYVDYIDGVKPFEAGLLTVALGGSYLGSCFVQEEPFYTAQNVAVLLPKIKDMNEYVNIFISGLIRYESKIKYYAFGRELNAHIGREFSIKIPVNNVGKPNWLFMEEYIKSLRYRPLTTHNTPKNTLQLAKQNWKEFRFGDLISSIYKAKAINKDNITIATEKAFSIRYITRTAENNGCELQADIRDIDERYIEKGNAISIGDTTATCFYQDEQFITGDHMVIIRADKWLNKTIAIFILTLLNNEQYKYSYGRAFLIDRIKDTLLKLPVNNNGEPDWEYMETYIKSLPYGDRL